MSDMHSFSVDVAKEVGVNAAILLQSIKFWCAKNKANGKNEHEGLYWTYNSVKAWQELYPYLGKSAIDSALKKLEERGYIRVGNFNKLAYDRTKWYAITEKGLLLFENPFLKNGNGNAENENGSSENQETIPDASQLLTDSSTNAKAASRPPVKEIIDYLNEKTGRSYRPTAKKARELISARWSESYTLDDFKKVIDNMCARWKGTEWEQYLQPSTLFAPSHFDEYLNRADASKPRKDGLSLYHNHNIF